MRFTTSVAIAIAAAIAPTTVWAYWMEDIAHSGRSAYHPDPNFQVFRNVKDFGAVGDGVTDDTAAINRAISLGGRCGPQECAGNTVSAATIYFPPGTYLISSSIIDYYYTQIIGDPTDLPVIKASANFDTTANLGLLDGNRYGPNGLAWKAVNTFFRQVRNLVFDTTAIPPQALALGIHWPSSQATAISNVVFKLSDVNESKHTGLFIEEGSGGLLNDLVFYGGGSAARFGNQQYTARNLTFYNADTAIEQLWDWGWTYKSLNVYSCNQGIRMVDASTGSITLLDSVFKSVKEAVVTHRDPAPAEKPAAGALTMYNVHFDEVDSILVSAKQTIIKGNVDGDKYVERFAMGHVYSPEGPAIYQGDDQKLFVPVQSLKSGGDKYYEKSKPHYENVPASDVVTARSFGAVGDGKADDTMALNRLFAHVASNPQLIAFVDAGSYVVTDTVHIPAYARIVGEALASVILGAGPRFSNMANPHPVVQVGKKGESGRIEWSDMIVSTRGATAGAIGIEFNLASPAGCAPSGIWDVHVRIAGFAGTDLLLEQCATNASVFSNTAVNEKCIAAYMSMHITRAAEGLYMENCWLWVADHDLEDDQYRQVTIFAGRGMLIEAGNGRVWLSGVGVEHHVLYNYQLANTHDIYMSMPQSETPYFQPNPPANVPFPPVAEIYDPDFLASCGAASGGGVNSNGTLTLYGAPCAMSWGLRVIRSRDVVIFGAGFYSFFNNNSDACCQPGAPVDCQARIVEILDAGAPKVKKSKLRIKRGGDEIAYELRTQRRHSDDSLGSTTDGFTVYNLNTIGTVAMVTRLGQDIAFAEANSAGFADNVCVYKH